MQNTSQPISSVGLTVNTGNDKKVSAYMDFAIFTLKKLEENERLPEISYCQKKY